MDRRAWLVDGAVGALAFAISAAILRAATSVGPDVRDADFVAYALLGLQSVALVLRNRWPVAAVVLGMGAAFAYSAASYPLALTPVLLPAVYTAGARMETRSARRLLAFAVVAAALGATLAPGPTSTSPPVLVAAAWVLGRYVGSRRRYTEELEAKNRELEQAQLDLARQAVTEERLRIARELHDVVAHSLSVVAVHAGSGRMVASEDPAAAERALATIETTTRSALVEMRRLLGVLRSGDEPEPGALGPAPGLGAVDSLVAEVRRSGLPVELRVRGERPAAVPTGVDLSAYRIVQEALTNVLRHAGPARALVEVAYGAGRVDIVVEDDGAGPAAGGGAAAASTGHGLAGMRERVAVHGGRLDAGPGPSGGFRVVASLPLEGP